MSWRPMRLLMSYHYIKQLDLRAVLKTFEHQPIFFADSGAYTAQTQGAEISLDEYCEWLHEHRDLFELFATLDVIGDAEASCVNWERMRAKGLKPIPAFHAGEPMDYLRRYIDAGEDYIALGGMVGAGAPRLMPWIVACFRLAREYKDRGRNVVFHGFGITNLDVLSSLPWYTVDSSAWGQVYRYGTFRLFDKFSGKWLSTDLFTREATLGKMARAIQEEGFDLEPFLNREVYHHCYAAMISARSWRSFETHLRRRWGAIELAGKQPGLHIYMAEGSHELARMASFALAQDPQAMNVILEEVREKRKAA